MVAGGVPRHRQTLIKHAEMMIFANRERDPQTPSKACSISMKIHPMLQNAHRNGEKSIKIFTIARTAPHQLGNAYKTYENMLSGVP